MPLDTGVTSIKLSGGTLHVRGDLGVDDEAAFSKAADELLATEHPEMMIDISGVRYISSIYVRDIALAMVHADDKGRSVSVRATDTVARILALGGVDSLGKVEVVE
jgi:anti-anti-sigma factor